MQPTSSTRAVIFVSHATPEDNDFTIWLASRLQADGFDVWIDKQALIGGEKFWQEIDQTIRHRAIKFLLVYSENICFQKQRGKLKGGIEKEKSLAESIAKTNNLPDFTILLNIDGSEYNLFIGADMLNQIPFYENWAAGYSLLLKKLDRDGIHPQNAPVNDFAKWYEDEYILNSGVKPLHELYYDSWWNIKKLPDTFCIYRFVNDTIASHVQRQCPYPASRITNSVSSFYDTNDFEVEIDGEVGNITPRERHIIKASDAIAAISVETDSTTFPNSQDIRNHLTYLLQNVFHQIMRDRHLSWYRMANKKLAYFFTPRQLGQPVKFQYSLRNQKKKQSKRKALYGQYYTSCWHFALSGKPVLSPQTAFSLKSHLVFTHDGQRLWNDKDDMHSARRKKGKRLFNEDWRDMLFAFLHALCADEDKVTIPLSPSFTLELLPWTNRYHSDFGYTEPKEKDRYDILDYDEESSEEDDDTDLVEVEDA